MYKKRVTNLVKQDIRDIPFDELALQCVAAAKIAVQDAVDQLQQSLDHVYQHHVTKALQLSGESTEGIEEGVREGMTLLTAELTPEKAWAIRHSAYKTQCVAFCEKYTLKARAAWLPAQLVALAGSWTPRHGDVGTGYCAKATLDQVLGSGNRWLIGCYYFMMYAKRGDYVGTQYKEPDSYYCALVPLILSGFKKYQKIDYSRWNLSKLEWIMEPSLYEAVTCEVPPDITTADLLGIREAGMLINSGTKKDTKRNPLTTFKLWGVGDSLVGKLPWLAQVMLTQIWCAHPSNRNSYMILDPQNWDTMPPALVDDVWSTEYVSPTAPKRYLPTMNNSADFAWDA